MHGRPLFRLLLRREIPHECAERVGLSLSRGRRDRQFYRNLVPVPVAACDFDPRLQDRSFAGWEERTHSAFMGFPMLCSDNGGGEESPDGLLPGPAEHLFGLDVPLGNDSSGIHPDEGIKRRRDDTPRVCLALAQRHLDFPGMRTFLLEVASLLDNFRRPLLHAHF